MNLDVKTKTLAQPPAFGLSYQVAELCYLKNRRRVASIFGWLLAVLGLGLPVQGAVNVTQHHNHLSRDGLYIDPAFTTFERGGPDARPGV